MGSMSPVFDGLLPAVASVDRAGGVREFLSFVAVVPGSERAMQLEKDGEEGVEAPVRFG